MHYFDQSATIQLAYVFLIAGCWVSVDFDSKYKILWGKPWAYGVLIYERKKMFETRIYIIIPIFPPPIISD